MDKKYREAYETVNISDDVKKRIKSDIINGNDKAKTKQVAIYRHMWKRVAVAAVIASIVVPTGVYAVQKIVKQYSMNVETNNHNVNFKISKAPEKKTDDKSEMQYVKVTGDFEKNYTEYLKEQNGSNRFFARKNVEHSEDNLYDISYELLYMDGENSSETVAEYFVGEKEEFESNGMKGVCLTYNAQEESNEDEQKCHKIYLFNEEYGYFVSLFADAAISKEEVLDLAKSIKMTPVADKSEASAFTLYSESGYAADYLRPDEYAAVPVSSSKFAKENEIKTDKSSVRVTDVKIFDSLKELENENFDCKELTEEYKECFDENGKLKSYDREIIQFGDGINTLDKVLESKTVQPKFVCVTAEVENSKEISEEGIVEPLYIMEYEIGENGRLIDLSSSQKYYRSSEIATRTDCVLCREFEDINGYGAIRPTDDKLTVHYVFVVDDDLLETMAVEFNWENASAKYIDISQK